MLNTITKEQNKIEKMALNKASIMRQEYKSLTTLHHASHSKLLFRAFRGHSDYHCVI